MRIHGHDEPETSDEWVTLHQGTGREEFDAPERFDLHRLPRMVRTEPRTVRTEPVRTTPKRSLVRPYARTGGRTRPLQELTLESLVWTTEAGRRYQGAVSGDQRFICDLCVESRSIAEVAAYVHLPLGVVKVMVDDLASAGAVEIHNPGLLAADRSSIDFMSRILEGLRAL
ncbi:uncharacterized protein DUF742 [Prauserella shujinwangii]|uniref:Uncharacterized protein DUF742 n=1 Tax=Prauserella shujinwangii TaxID=1453103 RepID=A0A2T0M0Y4_9PSEU|nr:DUF742 domain-containing protein [Prauserella shujinwangii]PRX50264.1 uncharacterized protein DUF742 [Prauserella shujinwangii]